MKIAGIQKLSLVDYPGKMACTVFTSGCNFRCPFCHNASLVTHTTEEAIHVEEVKNFLKKRQGLLDALVISGGEPLIHDGVDELARYAKSLGYFVKLDTNGTFPEKLIGLVGEGIIDYVAMDIKNSRQKYAQIAGVKNIDLSPIEKSIEFLKSGKVDFEFRTTVVKEFHVKEDFKDISDWIGSEPKYFLQKFVDSGDLIESNLHGYDDENMKILLDFAKKHFKNVQLRGV